MLAIKCGKIIPVTKQPIENGVILVEDEKIKKVGAESSISIPKDAQVIDGSDWIAFPGIIDPHSHAGVYEEEVGLGMADGNEATDPVTPHIRALDAITPEDPGIRRALSGGVTTICVTPGSANVLGGKTVTMKTYGEYVEDMVLDYEAGVKAAFGENPRRVYGEMNKTPSTRMGNIGKLREALVNTQNYMNKWKEYHRKQERYERELEEWKEEKEEEEVTEKDRPELPTKPEKNLLYEALSKVLENEQPLRCHAHRKSDIMTAIRIAEEFDIDITIEHCTDGHKCIDVLKEKDIPAVVGPSLGFRSKIELRDLTWHTIGKLYNEGCLVALTSDHPVLPLQFQNVYAAIATREELPRQGAYEVLTINPAKILGIDDRVGSLEEGKDADVILFDGDPLNARSKVRRVLVNGEVAYDRSETEGELY